MKCRAAISTVDHSTGIVLQKCGACGLEWTGGQMPPDCLGPRAPGTVTPGQFDDLMAIMDDLHYEDEDGVIWPLVKNPDLKGFVLRDILNVIDTPYQ